MIFDAILASSFGLTHCNWKNPFDNNLLVQKFEECGWEKGGVYDLSRQRLQAFVEERVLLGSAADLLVISALDQHNPSRYDISSHLKQIRERYSRVIMNTTEPIYNSLKPEEKSKRTKLAHELFCRNLQPDLVIYNSKIDVELSPFNSIYVANGDVSLREASPLSWSDRDNVFVFSGIEFIRDESFTNHKGELISKRSDNLNFIKSIAGDLSDFSYVNFNNEKSFKELYAVASKSKFEIQPRCGYHLHGSRALMAMLCGSIPIIFAQSKELHKYYGDILIDSETCFIVDCAEISSAEDFFKAEGEHKRKLIKKIENKSLCTDISDRIIGVAEDYCSRHNLKKVAEYFK